MMAPMFQSEHSSVDIKCTLNQKKNKDDFHVLVSSVVSSPGITFAIFVSHNRSNCLHHGNGGEVLRWYEFQALEEKNKKNIMVSTES